LRAISPFFHIYICSLDVGLEEILRLLKPSLYAESSSQHQLSQTVISINVEGNDIQGNTIENSPLLSKYDCSLQTLNLSSNPISMKGQEGIAKVLLNNQILKHLYLDNCSFDLDGLIIVAANLVENESLQTLSLNRPILTNIKEELVIDHFHRALLSNRCLRSLSLKYYKIQDFGAKLLSDSLQRNYWIQSLNLECNNINVAGAEAIASYLLLKGNKCLQFLGLSYNLVGDDGAIALAEV
jgi:Ran GTPase-activating protein (RanGAP) involved in mRNA processing and transport